MFTSRGSALVAAILVASCGGGSGSDSNATQTASVCEQLIPAEQPAAVRHEVTKLRSPPPGFTAVIAWATATVGQGGTTGNVTVKNLQLWEREGGVLRLLASTVTCPSCALPADRVWGYSLAKRDWANPTAWERANEGAKFAVDDTSAIVPVASLPADVYHLWNTVHPRPDAKATAEYFVIGEVFVTGDAVVQIGIDFWASPVAGPNTEAALSNWHCVASGAGTQTIRAGAYQ